MSRDEFTLPTRQRTDIGDGSLDSGAGPLFVRLACWSGGWETRRVVAGPQSHQLRLAGRADEHAEVSGLIRGAAAFTGLRWGEVLALRRIDVDLDVGTVRVHRSIAQLGGGRLVSGPPKSRAGVRTVTLPQVLIEELRMHMVT
jgi:integrase